ncbi:MAG: hypothetical protein JRJ08_02625 [Deltaproteobacteria bacterium]|nr:hypothetical protein [Deltaproteobacteria bacterium]
MSLLVGCGVKSPPVVPHSPIPQAIKGLEALSSRGTIILQWSIPQKDSDGKKLTSLGGFHIWRQFIPIEEIGCSTCKADLKLLVEIDYRLPHQNRRRQGKITYWDDQVEKEGKYIYKIISYTTIGVKSSVSNAAVINWSPPLSPPLSLKAPPGDRVVNLSWESRPSLGKDAYKNRLNGFNVYRRRPGEDYVLTPLNNKPILENNFRDMGVTNGEKYYYVVRTLKNTEGVAIESGDSIEVEVIPEDFTPPASPYVTMAFQSLEGIVITWEPDLDPDLEGYFVYRRLETEDKSTLISPLLKGKTMYLDKTFSPGLTYYYSVTAVDRSRRHNESDFSQELKVVTETETYQGE